MRRTIPLILTVLFSVALLSSVFEPASLAKQQSSLNTFVSNDALFTERVAAPAAQGCDAPVEACGWYPAGPIEGGCRDPGQCESDVGDILPGLYEYAPDQEDAPREPWSNYTWFAEHTGPPDYPTYVKREVCWNPPEGGRGALPEAWPKGRWHHGAYWERVQGVWKRSRDHWAFFHNDRCDGPVGLPGDPGLPSTFPPTPTPTPVWTATPAPTPRPGYVRITVWQCQSGRAGLDSSIDVYAGSWSDRGHGSSVEFEVPAGYTTVTWQVAPPSGWSLSEDRGNISPGTSVNVVATSPSCQATPGPGVPTPTPGQGTPSPTVPPRWCPGATHGPRGSYIGLSVAGAPTYAAGGTRNFQFGSVPPYIPNAEMTLHPENTPLDVTYDWSSLHARDFEAGHTGFGRVRLVIWDQTAGRMRLDVDASRPEGEPTFPPDGWALTPKTAIVDDLRPGGTFAWFHRSAAHGTWDDSTQMPKLGGWYVRDTAGTTRIIFMPEPGHRYAIWSTAGHDACRVDFAEWRIAYVDVDCTGEDCPPPPECPGGAPVCPPGPINNPVPPTPTPPPPPAPPQAFATTRLALHSRYDPKHGGPDVTDAIHTSTGTTVAWPQGEILDFAPAVTLHPLPAPPVDPYWGRLYSYEQEILGWSYVTDQPCRGGATARDGLAGCSFAYVPAADESTMANQGHVLWTAGSVPAVPANVYAHHLGTLAPVSLPIQVLVETRTLNRSGMVLLRRQTVLSATFRVELVAPRTVR